MADSINLAATVANHQGTVSLVALAPMIWTQLLRADARRWFLRITPAVASLGEVLYSPAVIQSLVGVPVGTAIPLELKYRDCPALVCGEWWAISNIGGSVLVLENTVLRS